MAQCLDESDEFDCPMTTTTTAVGEEEEEEGEAEMFWFGSAYDEDAFEEGGGEGAEEDQVSLIFSTIFPRRAQSPINGFLLLLVLNKIKTFMKETFSKNCKKNF